MANANQKIARALRELHSAISEDETLRNDVVSALIMHPRGMHAFAAVMNALEEEVEHERRHRLAGMN